jgi:hypothetical protein
MTFHWMRDPSHQVCQSLACFTQSGHSYSMSASVRWMMKKPHQFFTQRRSPFSSGCKSFETQRACPERRKSKNRRNGLVTKSVKNHAQTPPINPVKSVSNICQIPPRLEIHYRLLTARYRSILKYFTVTVSSCH